MNKKVLFLCLTASAIIHAKLIEKPIVVVIPSYKNEVWVENNLVSVFKQKYHNFRIIYIDDQSPDQTLLKVKELIKKWNFSEKIDLIHNSKRKGALRNIYESVHSCNDDEIIVTLDGDDWFPHKNVLSTINKVYSKKSAVWLTHGSYLDSKGNLGIQNTVTENVIRENLFRGECRPSHLRTFYAWLFKKIKQEDLMYEGDFFSMTWDLAMMFPMMEMAGERQAHIPEIIYIYNVENPISDFAKDPEYQIQLDKYIHAMPKYHRLY